MIAQLNEGWNLPPSWEWSTTGYITNNHDNKRIPVKVADRAEMQGPYPYYGASGVIDWVDDYLFNGEYLLITEDGNLLTGSSSVAFLAKGKFWVNNHAHVVQTLGNLPLCYLKANLNYVNLAGYVTGTTRPKLTQTALNRIPIPLAPLPEQHRIVAEIERQFTRLDASVASLERVRANLRRYRTSVLKAACEGRLVATEAELARAEGRQYEHADELLERILAERRGKWESQQAGRRTYREPVAPDDSELSSLPEGWVWSNIGQLSTVGSGSTPLTSRREYYQHGTVPWITSSALNNSLVLAPSKLVTEQAVRECRLSFYPPHTLLVAMYGEGKTRGKCSELLISSTINQAIAAVAMDESAASCRAYIKVFLDSNYEATRHLSSGGVQPNLNLGLVRKIEVPLPPVAEQSRIVAEVERRLSIIKQVEEAVDTSLKRAERLRQSVLKQAFCGRLVPQDPGDEPAYALLERISAQRAEAQPATEANRKRGRRTRRSPRGIS